MSTFIRVAEVWVPSADGHLLELAHGLYRQAPQFGAASRDMCFGRAEGLPGHAWEDGRPLLLHGFEGSVFRRTAAAQAAGLSCAVALPIFVGDQLRSVVLLLCADAAPELGAMEMWRHDPRVGSDMTLDDGYFGSTPAGAALEDLTRDGSLPRGHGLPGLAWQREAAVFIDNVGESHHFLRSQTTAQAGLVRGLAIPCTTRGHMTWVLSLLSAASLPIARRVESWIAADGGAGQGLQRAFGFCEAAGNLPTAAASQQPLTALGVIGRAWAQASAQAAHGDAAAAGLPADARAAGLGEVLAIPVVSADQVSEVVALYF